MANSSEKKAGKMCPFETLVIALPSLEKEELDKAMAKLDGTITKLGGKVVRSTQWGKKHLSFEIKKQHEGHYVLVEFDSTTDVPRRVQEFLRVQPEILRAVTTQRRPGAVPPTPMP